MTTQAVHARQRTLDAALAALLGDVSTHGVGAACPAPLVQLRGRLRTVLLTGPAGSGKSHLADALVARMRELGHEVAVIDDAHDLGPQALVELVESSVAAHARGALDGLVVTTMPAAGDLRRVVGRVADCVELALPPLDADGVRSVLAEHGVAPWTVRAAGALRSARGNPQRALDVAFGADPAAAQPRDELGALLASWPLLRDTTEAIFRGDDPAVRLLVAGAARRWRESRDAEAGVVLLDALEEEGPSRAAVLEALGRSVGGGSTVDVTRLAGDVAAVAQRAGDRALVLHAAIASARARVRAGDDVLLTALATLADEAVAAGRPDLGVEAWCTIALARARRDEHASAHAAIERALVVGDTAGLVRHGLRARIACARVAGLAGRAEVARELLDDVIEHAGVRRLDGIVLAAAPELVRARRDVAGAGAGSWNGDVAGAGTSANASAGAGGDANVVGPAGRLTGVLATDHVAAAGSRTRTPSRRLQLAVTVALGQQGSGDRAGVRGTLVAAVDDQLRTALGGRPVPGVLAQVARLLAWAGAASSDLRPLLLLVDAAPNLWPERGRDDAAAAAADAELRAVRAELRGWRARAIGDLTGADAQLARARCEWRLAGSPEQAAACAALERALDGARIGD